MRYAKGVFEVVFSAAFRSLRVCRSLGAACPVAATTLADLIWDGVASLWNRLRGKPPEYEIERSERAVEYIKKLDEAEKVKGDGFERPIQG